MSEKQKPAFSAIICRAATTEKRRRLVLFYEETQFFAASAFSLSAVARKKLVNKTSSH
ncbi:hypothetical protein SD77_3095 [Bacillus badius]|uniref:Uncharacterized protein n=1 Tax=Bacillus badius TaxID=1455 RepID=A0ABR5AWX0_BACBA|nr:hypothetical protein SD78_0307 [Bacillus badius]KIL79229.1 hypothetical protein SD77_3095 [Bacillus badius]